MTYRNQFENVSGRQGNDFIGTEIFPAVLHNLLDEAERKGYSHIVSWKPHGRGFEVHKRKEFSQFVMPAFFRMSKYASFQRQLNLYDFNRITAGPDKGGYFNEMFVRGQKELCRYMLRRPMKGTLTCKPAPEAELDFYCTGMDLQGDRSTTLSTLIIDATDCRVNATGVPASMPPPSCATNNNNATGCMGPYWCQQHPKMMLGDLRDLNDHQSSLLGSDQGVGPTWLCRSCNKTGEGSQQIKHMEQGDYSVGTNVSVVQLLDPHHGYSACQVTRKQLKTCRHKGQGLDDNGSGLDFIQELSREHR